MLYHQIYYICIKDKQPHRIKNRCLPFRNNLAFASTPCFFGEIRVAHLISCLCCPIMWFFFTLWIPSCDVRYDFHIKTMFGSSLPPVLCRRVHILFTLFVFVWVWCLTHIMLCFLLSLSSSCVPGLVSFSALSILIAASLFSSFYFNDFISIDNSDFNFLAFLIKLA
jgi:hypothetical protein